MLNLKKVLTKISIALKSKTLESTDMTVTTSAYGTASLGIYRTSKRVLAVDTGTTADGQNIVVQTTLVGDTYWVQCRNSSTGEIVKNTDVLLRIVSAPVSFFEAGGVIPELIHKFRTAITSLRKEVVVC